MPGLGNGIQATAKLNAASSVPPSLNPPFMAGFCSTSSQPVFFARLSCFCGCTDQKKTDRQGDYWVCINSVLYECYF
jgi:hypothetical protein